MMQTLITALLVAGCAGYATWTLMPATLRRRIANAALAYPMPDLLARRLRRFAAAPSGCGCDGCDRSPKTSPPDGSGGTPITFHRRPQR